MPLSLSPRDDIYYSQLARGARFLARGAASTIERDLHLGMADRYARLSANAAFIGESLK